MLLRKTLPHSKSAAKWTHNEKLKRLAQKSWQKSKRYDRMKKTDPTTPSNKFINLVAKLPRKLVSILAQLRTGHAPLAKHLHRIGKMDSPICPACSQCEETIQHFMLHCTAHQVARQALAYVAMQVCREFALQQLITDDSASLALNHCQQLILLIARRFQARSYSARGNETEHTSQTEGEKGPEAGAIEWGGIVNISYF
jgi:zinc-binding in reverse transcriptase